MMRILFLTTLIALAGTTSHVRAGVYFPGEPKRWPVPDRFNAYWSVLGNLTLEFYTLTEKEKRTAKRDVAELEARKRKEGLEPEEALKLRNIKKALEVEKKLEHVLAAEQKNALTHDDRLWLSAFYVYNPNHRDSLLSLRHAKRLLDRGLRDSPRDVRLLGNFAMVCQRLAEIEPIPARRGLPWAEARQAISKTLDNWPKKTEGWTDEQAKWYRDAETAYLKLIELRAGEEVGANVRDENVDALFDLEWRKIYLPADAHKIVQQLLLWMPYDNRLRWLYAEMLVVRGDLIEAELVMRDLWLVRKYNNAVRLRRHLNALQKAVREGKGQAGIDAGPGIERAGPPPQSGGGNDKDNEKAAVKPYQFALIGLAAGVFVGILVALQVREIQRRVTAARERKRQSPSVIEPIAQSPRSEGIQTSSHHVRER